MGAITQTTWANWLSRFVCVTAPAKPTNDSDIDDGRHIGRIERVISSQRPAINHMQSREERRRMGNRKERRAADSSRRIQKRLAEQNAGKLQRNNCQPENLIGVREQMTRDFFKSFEPAEERGH